MIFRCSLPKRISDTKKVLMQWVHQHFFYGRNPSIRRIVWQFARGNGNSSCRRMPCNGYKKTPHIYPIRGLLPAAGLEPARCCQQQILSLPRLPFRHAGMSASITAENYNSIIVCDWQAEFSMEQIIYFCAPNIFCIKSFVSGKNLVRNLLTYCTEKSILL